MRDIPKIEKVKRRLMSGKSITDDYCRNNYRYTRLADAIYKLKHRDMWIINIGKPGKHANYLAFEKGPIKKLMILGHRLEILDAEYLPTHGSIVKDYSDMDILIAADDGIKKKQFWCDSSAFRDKKIMEKHIKDLINKE